MHNEVVKSDIHSTDTFGFSELVFGVSHLLGFSYAPRFKNLKRQRLYIFKSRLGVGPLRLEDQARGLYR
jgi:TnpA family transposase